MRSVGLLRGRNLIEREEADKEKGRAQARPLVGDRDYSLQLTKPNIQVRRIKPPNTMR